MAADVASEEQFGPYLVYERLGVGGMATVHRALERGIEGFERVVALKRLLPHLAADGSFIKSFVREAKLASQLNHVNIVSIFELGRVGTEYFISMEYIDGRDIRRILRHARKVSGPPPIHVTAGLLIQLCDALDYAHHKVDDEGQPLGLVHRDVSPSNVLVTSAGQVKVIDFGIAKAQSIQLRTQTGRVKGKLAYMAPEALTGKPLDARSDLFAAGIIAHELLTARPLFATKNEYETLMKVQRGDIMPPSTFNQACPAELDAIVLRALARDPDDRFASATEMRDELHALRKQYHLQTSDRDIAMWLDWAFSLEAPGGNFTASHTFDPSSSAAAAVAAPRNRPSKPKKLDDDDSIDLAWGGLDEHNNGAPVVLDDVPDVSDKHLGTASALGAEVRLDFDDLADDIPSSQPSHGIRPAAPSRAATAAALLAKPASRPRPPTPSAQLRSGALPAQPQAASATLPPRIRTITVPPPGTGQAPSTRPSLSPPPPAGNADGTPAPTLTSGTPRAIATASIPPTSVPASSSAIPTIPASSSPIPTIPTPAPTPSAAPPTRKSQRLSTMQGTMPSANDSQPTERTPALGHVPSPTPPRPIAPVVPPARQSAMIPAQPPVRRSASMIATPAPAAPSPQDAAETLVSMPAMSNLMPATRPSIEDFTSPSDTISEMPALQTSEPIVRFRAPSTPPPHARPVAPSARSTGSHAAQLPAEAPSIVDDAITPSLGSAAAPPEAAAPAPATSEARPRLITPATKLFAEPEPDGDDDDSSMTIVSNPAHHAEIAAISPPLSTRLSDRPSSTSTETRPAKSSKRTVAILAATLVLGAAAAGVALYLNRMHHEASDATPPQPVTAPRLGSIKLSTMPTDAAITIAGQPVHMGSPWSVEIAPGIHQIEIHRDGYKAWLTSIDVIAGQTRPVHVVLEPLDRAVLVANATLLVDPPRDHEVLLDGVALPAGAPLRHSLAIGSHTVILRKAGTELWKTTFDAKSSAVYDLTPILSREAERADQAAPAPAPPTDDASGSAAPQGSQLGTITPAPTPPVPPPPAPH